MKMFSSPWSFYEILVKYRICVTRELAPIPHGNRGSIPERFELAKSFFRINQTLDENYHSECNFKPSTSR